MAAGTTKGSVVWKEDDEGWQKVESLIIIALTATLEIFYVPV